MTLVKFGTLDNFLVDLLLRNTDPEHMAVALGGAGSTEKLPGLGIALAAEFLKNVGFDVSKPDRHINRAVGCFGLLQFKSWKDRRGFTPPAPTQAELVAVMYAVRDIAVNASESTTFVDNAIWLLCAQSGLHLSNPNLEILASHTNRV